MGDNRAFLRVWRQKEKFTTEKEQRLGQVARVTWYTERLLRGEVLELNCLLIGLLQARERY